MKKSLIAAGAVACALALPAAAENGMVDIELTVDREQSAEAIYEQVLEKAADVCLSDTFCEIDLVEALVDAIDDDAVSAVHQAYENKPFQVAASE